jgi:hypothetical protein
VEHSLFEFVVEESGGAMLDALDEGTKFLSLKNRTRPSSEPKAIVPSRNSVIPDDMELDPKLSFHMISPS